MEESSKATKTRGGGTFSDPEAIQLHANDFSWQEKMEELNDDERKLVQSYILLSEQKLMELGTKSISVSPPSAECKNNTWDSHYQVNKRHFPLKNYIILAFPLIKEICSSTPQRETRYILECGCGTGSTLLPLMRQFRENVNFIGFDVSERAVSLLLDHPISNEFVEGKRLTAFTHDISSVREWSSEGPEKTRVRKESGVLKSVISKRVSACIHGVDVILLVFVLSSLPSLEAIIYALKELASVLRPEGVLLFRDYAVPDHNMFRFTKQGNERVNNLSFRKGDGTLQMFFEAFFIRKLFAMAGLEEIEGHGLNYHCNRIINRKNGKKMDKIFINGSFRLSPRLS
ncbi:methyltransferase domain-containing protein [Trypanosoma rangeli]|uniref:tRNA N(3)-methylcytidine methyltransferase n=1 Tax=Trypanosoma rangeli TaxID=5698 RepID=A0A422MZQ7_TRYRA|nr:methyltransferase domain-containing protein [Trypanosoma rangeli]RNE98703.1 methyltransferase domain-containing protein [Trypanosoma rangeli]|eukprot:RNE98703.1 methyltransferase domain-containing protein [Trypanosoma rangeli]